MTRINCTITASDDNHLIFETRGGKPTLKTIPRDDNAATGLFDAVEAALKANERRQPEAPAPAATVATPAKSEPIA